MTLELRKCCGPSDVKAKLAVLQVAYPVVLEIPGGSH